MARMSIDDRFLRDPRVTELAIAIGWNKYEARGRLLEVFAIVYDRVNAGSEPLLTPANIDTAAEWPGLSERLIEFNLAVRTRRGMIHVRGAKEYTNYLNTRVSSGRSGGVQSGETRRKKALEKSKVTFDKTEGPSNPSASAPASALSSPSPSVNTEGGGSAPLVLFALDGGEAPKKPGPAAPKPKVHPDRPRVIDAFHQRYKQAYGTKPTWDDKTVGQVGTLLKKHTGDVLIARIHFMFDGRAKWPDGPYTLGKFVSHIDAWVDESPRLQQPIRKLEKL